MGVIETSSIPASEKLAFAVNLLIFPDLICPIPVKSNNGSFSLIISLILKFIFPLNFLLKTFDLPSSFKVLKK